MSRTALNSTQRQSIALSGVDVDAEPLTETKTTKRTTKKAAALTED